jgi:hypothetical protein
MKRTIFVLLTILVVFVIVLAVLVVHPVRTVKAQRHGCSNRTLFGDYGGTISGTIQGPTGGPVTMVGLLHFDGDEGLSGSEGYQTVPNASAPHNFINSGPGTSWTGGTYEVLSTCSFTATIPGTPPATLQGVVVNADGSEVIGEMFTASTVTPGVGNPGNAGMGIFDIKKVSDLDDR